MLGVDFNMVMPLFKIVNVFDASGGGFFLFLFQKALKDSQCDLANFCNLHGVLITIQTSRKP